MLNYLSFEYLTPLQFNRMASHAIYTGSLPQINQLVNTGVIANLTSCKLYRTNNFDNSTILCMIANN